MRFRRLLPVAGCACFDGFLVTPGPIVAASFMGGLFPGIPSLGATLLYSAAPHGEMFLGDSGFVLVICEFLIPRS